MSYTTGLGWGKKKLVDEIIKQIFKIEKVDDQIFSYNDLLYIVQEMNKDEGRAYLEGGEQLRGFELFRNFVDYLLYRNLANFDSMILLTSEKGQGKSSAAIMIARRWCKIIGIKFDPKRHIAYSNADMMNKVDNLNKFEPLIADEAVRFASSEEWAKKENRELKKKLAQCRTKHLLFILCFPLKIYKLDKTYLESYTNYWCDLFGRGVGAIFVKDKNPVMDSWRMKDFIKVGSYTEFTDINKIKETLKKHPNFWHIIKFPKPPELIYSNYLKVREQNVYDDQNVLASISKEDIINALLILSLRDIMTSDVSLTLNRIILHISNEYDVKLNKGTVQTQIEDAKQLVMKLKENAISL